LFGHSHSGTFYNTSKEKVMPRLTVGIPKLAKNLPRNDKRNHSQLSCINYEEAIQAKTFRVKPK